MYLTRTAGIETGVLLTALSSAVCILPALRELKLCNFRIPFVHIEMYLTRTAGIETRLAAAHPHRAQLMYLTRTAGIETDSDSGYSAAKAYVSYPHCGN